MDEDHTPKESASIQNRVGPQMIRCTEEMVMGGLPGLLLIDLEAVEARMFRCLTRKKILRLRLGRRARLAFHLFGGLRG